MIPFLVSTVTLGGAGRAGRGVGRAAIVTLWNVIAWIIVGGIAGWIASMVMGSDARQGWVANVIVGIVGAVIGGFLLGFIPGLGTDLNDAFSIGGMITAILGAIILLFILRLVQGRG